MVSSGFFHLDGGDDGIRTHDPLLAGQVLSQLSYTPIKVCSSISPTPFYRKFLWLAFFSKKVTGGDDGIRTHDPLLAGQVLSQLSYTPI